MNHNLTYGMVQIGDMRIGALPTQGEGANRGHALWSPNPPSKRYKMGTCALEP